MVMVKADTKRATKRRSKKILIGTGILIVVYAISLFTPLISSYSRYPIYLVKCGGAPVITSDLAGKSYTLPGDPAYGPSLFKNGYYCSEQEAIDRGYRSYNKN